MDIKTIRTHFLLLSGLDAEELPHWEPLLQQQAILVTKRTKCTDERFDSTLRLEFATAQLAYGEYLLLKRHSGLWDSDEVKIGEITLKNKKGTAEQQPSPEQIRRRAWSSIADLLLPLSGIVPIPALNGRNLP